MCDKGFIWNPSNFECECDKSCDVGQYLHYENCKCRRKSVDKLVEGCSKNIDEFVVCCFIAVFVYFYWYSKKDNVRVKFNPGTQTTIY